MHGSSTIFRLSLSLFNERAGGLARGLGHWQPDSGSTVFVEYRFHAF
jgi:hypothetical protein